jgi:hypothetical protein
MMHINAPSFKITLGLDAIQVYFKFATCAVQIRYNSTFRKAPIRGINTLSSYFHIQYTLSNSGYDKSRY